jgi:ribose 1,5-bisphosphate isomerase
MSQHVAVREVIEGFENAELHAARSGREVMRALAQVAVDSTASDASGLGDEIESAIDALLTVMPAYAPPINAMHLVMSRVDEALAGGATAPELRATLTRDAEDFLVWCEEARAKVARHGAEIIHDGATVFTFTLGETILSTLQEAWAQGRNFEVLVTESRPNNDGLVTAAELGRAGVPVSVSVDACLGELVPQADVMMVGAEAIMADGTTVCKVGTYPSALVAHAHGVPVYVVMDTLKFYTTSMLGLPLNMDRLHRRDILPPDAPRRARVTGHLFDQTPPHLVTGVVTERGILSPAACTAVMREMRLSETLNRTLATWAHHWTAASAC